MLLSIDEAKVAELLETSNKGYAVFALELPKVELKRDYRGVAEVSGTVYRAPSLVTAETRERLVAARRQIEESGVPLKDAEDLTKEIDEMRGRR